MLSCTYHKKELKVGPGGTVVGGLPYIYIICKWKCIPACVEKPGTICFTIRKGHSASNRQSANQFSCQGPQMASHLNYPSLAPLNGSLMPCKKKNKEQNECCAVPPFLTKECYNSPCAVFLPQNVWGLPAINSNQEGQDKKTASPNSGSSMVK